LYSPEPDTGSHQVVQCYSVVFFVRMHYRTLYSLFFSADADAPQVFHEIGF
jgi:sulfur transfer protein SufE